MAIFEKKFFFWNAGKNFASWVIFCPLDTKWLLP